MLWGGWIHAYRALPLCPLSSSAAHLVHATQRHLCQAQTVAKCFSFYPSFSLKVNPMECSVLNAIFGGYFLCTWNSVSSVVHAIKPPDLAQRAHLLLCIASWDWGCDLHASQLKRKNRHACWENRKKGGHKLNGSTPCCVMQWILPLIISNACITGEEAWSVCVHLKCINNFFI